MASIHFHPDARSVRNGTTRASPPSPSTENQHACTCTHETAGPTNRRPRRRRSTAKHPRDALDGALVRHAAGGTSVLGFKSYVQGREKWQAETLDLVWFDEESPLDIYMEGLTRTNATGGLVFLTMTPLKGMSDVLMLFKDCPEF